MNLYFSCEGTRKKKEKLLQLPKMGNVTLHRKKVYCNFSATMNKLHCFRLSCIKLYLKFIMQTQTFRFFQNIRKLLAQFMPEYSHYLQCWKLQRKNFFSLSCFWQYFLFKIFYLVLFYFAFFCSVLFCFILFCSVLFCIILFCSIHLCTVLFDINTIWFYIVLFPSVLHACSVLFVYFLF